MVRVEVGGEGDPDHHDDQAKGVDDEVGHSDCHHDGVVCLPVPDGALGCYRQVGDGVEEGIAESVTHVPEVVGHRERHDEQDAEVDDSVVSVGITVDKTKQWVK